MVNNRLAVQLPGLDLKNPVMPASGTCWYGQEMAQYFNLNVLGSLVIKSATMQPRAGNAKPRTTQTTGGWLNANGLQNVGVEQVVSNKLQWLATKFPQLPIVGSAAGFSIEEYVEVVRHLNEADNINAIELNVSCPNVAHGGMALGTDSQTVEELTKRCVAVSKVPLYVKLTPNITDITTVALAAERGGAAGLTLINTLTGLSIDLTTRKPALANGTGGLSGPAIKPLALAMIHQVRQVSELPIIGVGGIDSVEDVLEMMLAGANAVQIGAANFHDPFSCPKIIAQLPTVLDFYGIDSLASLQGVKF